MLSSAFSISAISKQARHSLYADTTTTQYYTLEKLKKKKKYRGVSVSSFCLFLTSLKIDK